MPPGVAFRKQLWVTFAKRLRAMHSLAFEEDFQQHLDRAIVADFLGSLNACSVFPRNLETLDAHALSRGLARKVKQRGSSFFLRRLISRRAVLTQ